MKKVILLAALAMMSVAALAQQKFAYVNFTELVQLMPEADQARATIDASTKEASETYQAMADEWNTKYQQYQQKASTWTPAIRETKEKELTDMQQRIQEFNQTVQAELQQQQQQLMAPLYKKAQETVEKLAKDGGYVFVIDQSTALYIDPAQADDLTKPARKILGIPDDRTMESLQKELQAQAQALAEQQ
ncbi:MAG: OmpH family outer membrane protein [Bacteroidales bacterium]|nr:OmpH family outer membrane protein [Bacteroidales bacterium]